MLGAKHENETLDISACRAAITGTIAESQMIERMTEDVNWISSIQARHAAVLACGKWIHALEQNSFDLLNCVWMALR